MKDNKDRDEVLATIILKIRPILYHACTRVDFTDIKKGLNLLNPLWCMVGRERFERSTIGLKVRCSTN